MMELKKNELKKISGGVSIWAIIGALAGLIFGIGVFEGYTRPINLPVKKWEWNLQD